MNNTDNYNNAILEAIGGLDNEVLENAFKPKRKKPLVLTIIAAAAALSLLVGFTEAVRPHYAINGEPVIDFNYKVHKDYVIPPIGEMIELGAKDFLIYHEDSEFVRNNFDFDATDDFTVFKPEYAPGHEPPEDLPFDILNDYEAGYTYAIDNVSPSTVIEKYGFKSYINEHFTEEVTLDDFPTEVCREGLTDAIVLLHQYPMQVHVFENGISMWFWLIDNESGLPLFVMNNHITGELQAPFDTNNTEYTDEYEIIELNDGNKAIVGMDGYFAGPDRLSAYAEFTYNGDFYNLLCPVDIDGMKRIIANFGFIDE